MSSSFSLVVVMSGGRIVLQGSSREVFQQVDRLRSLGLDVPQVTTLVRELAEAGMPLPTNLLTVEELVNDLCPLLLKS